MTLAVEQTFSLCVRQWQIILLCVCIIKLSLSLIILKEVGSTSKSNSLKHIKNDSTIKSLTTSLSYGHTENHIGDNTIHVPGDLDVANPCREFFSKLHSIINDCSPFHLDFSAFFLGIHIYIVAIAALLRIRVIALCRNGAIIHTVQLFVASENVA